VNEWFEPHVGLWMKYRSPGDIWILWHGYAHPDLPVVWFSCEVAS